MLRYLSSATDARFVVATVKSSSTSLFARLTPLLWEHAPPLPCHFPPWLFARAKNLMFTSFPQMTPMKRPRFLIILFM